MDLELLNSLLLSKDQTITGEAWQHRAAVWAPIKGIMAAGAGAADQEMHCINDCSARRELCRLVSWAGARAGWPPICALPALSVLSSM